MKKVTKDSKQLMFEMLAKIDPTYKPRLNEDINTGMDEMWADAEQRGTIGEKYNKWGQSQDAWADIESDGEATKARERAKELAKRNREKSSQGNDNSHVPEYYSTYDSGQVRNTDNYTQNQIDAMNDRSRNSMEKDVRRSMDNGDTMDEDNLGENNVQTALDLHSNMGDPRKNNDVYNKFMDFIKTLSPEELEEFKTLRLNQYFTKFPPKRPIEIGGGADGIVDYDR